MKNTLSIIIFLLVSWNISAQVNDKADLCTQEDFSLIESYYQDGSFLDYSYSYELNNRIKQIRMQKRHVITFGFLTTLGSMTAVAFVTDKHDWPLWASIPCITVIGLCEAAGFAFWAYDIERKATALEQQTSYMLSVNDNVDLGMARYAMRGNENVNGLGLAIKVNF